MKIRTRGRFGIKRLSRVLGDRLLGTPFEKALRLAHERGAKEFVFGWNRGLGDVALGLVPLFARIRAAIPDARIVVFTRTDLEEAFLMAGVDELVLVPGVERGQRVDPVQCARSVSRALAADAVIFADPDPTRWLDGQRDLHPPTLRWDADWNALADPLLAPDEKITVGAHVHSETARHYGYVKDWPAARWGELFEAFSGSDDVRFVLFGHQPSPAFAHANVVDLRGRTRFLELLAVIRRRCRILIAPDSGVLTATYYLAQDFPLDVISLWSDPRQGIIKQGCASPNPSLRHVPLLGPDEDVRNVDVFAVKTALDTALAHARGRAGTGA